MNGTAAALERSFIGRYFKFADHGTTIWRDTLAGATTFVVMSYIIFVNPTILSFIGIEGLQERGLPFQAVLASTCVVAGTVSILMGTIVGVGKGAGYVKPDGEVPGLRGLLVVDSLGTIAGGAASASSATTYIESGSGVAAGGRTGWTSVVTGLLFFPFLFFAPLIGMVPPHATAAALIVVGWLMISTLTEAEEEAEPGVVPVGTTDPDAASPRRAPVHVRGDDRVRRLLPRPPAPADVRLDLEAHGGPAHGGTP